MKSMRKAYLAVAMATLGLAAVLGGSLGMVAAGTRSNLQAGFNLAGGPLQADTAPDQFVGCLPANSWTAIYIWDAVNQNWKHYFNTGDGVPAYVNQAGVGGITTIPRFAGVVIIMKSAVSSPRLKDSNSESCS